MGLAGKPEIQQQPVGRARRNTFTSLDRRPSYESVVAALQRLQTVDRSDSKDLHLLATALEETACETPKKQASPTSSTTAASASPAHTNAASASPTPTNAPLSSNQTSPSLKSEEKEDLAIETKTQERPIQAPTQEGIPAEALTEEAQRQLEKDAKKREEIAAKKKAAHARYMRYYRSARSSELSLDTSRCSYWSAECFHVLT